MSKIKRRYEIIPHMCEYDKIGDIWLPYIMFYNQEDYSSPVVNTDSRGFRFSIKNSLVVKDFQNENDLPVGIVIGGSTAFGVGATNDSKTISSLLNAESDLLWFNFGGRAFNSTQEILLFLLNHHHVKNIKKVVIFSGINNLAIYYSSNKFNRGYGSFFFHSQFNKQMNYGTIDNKKKIILAMANFIFHKRVDDIINYKYLSKRDFIRKLFWEIGHGHSVKEVVVDDLENSTNDKKDILNIFERDLSNWQLLSNALGFKIYYVLQPFANWMARTKSKEEEDLFSILDEYRPAWKVLKNKIGPDLYLWFRESLGEICEKFRINFIDMNSLLLNQDLDEKWLFVDRIHLTDLGYETAVNSVKGDIL